VHATGVVHGGQDLITKVACAAAMHSEQRLASDDSASYYSLLQTKDLSVPSYPVSCSQVNPAVQLKRLAQLLTTTFIMQARTEIPVC